jgi:hypothetical protein
MTPAPTITREQLAFLNPPYISLLLHRFIHGYELERHTSPPLYLAFAAVPIVLYRPVRTALPRAVSTSLYVWVEEHRDLQLALAERAPDLTDITRAALMHGANAGLFSVSDARLHAHDAPFKASDLSKRATSDMALSLAKSAWLGRWFARAGDPVTVMLAWGLTV